MVNMLSDVLNRNVQFLFQNRRSSDAALRSNTPDFIVSGSLSASICFFSFWMRAKNFRHELDFDKSSHEECEMMWRRFGNLSGSSIRHANGSVRNHLKRWLWRMRGHSPFAGFLHSFFRFLIFWAFVILLTFGWFMTQNKLQHSVLRTILNTLTPQRPDKAREYEIIVWRKNRPVAELTGVQVHIEEADQQAPLLQTRRINMAAGSHRC
jgi:hypothetical protein